MQRKIVLSLVGVFLIISSANAQILNGSTSAVVQTASSQTTKTSISEASNSQTERLLSKEEIEALIKTEPMAAAMTPEQKAEIDIKAKKNMRGSIKKQSTGERKDFIDVMTSSEKLIARRKALAEGKSSAEAAQAEDKIKSPDINPSSDKEMENYLFEKAGLNSLSSASESISDAK